MTSQDLPASCFCCHRHLQKWRKYVLELALVLETNLAVVINIITNFKFIISPQEWENILVGKLLV